MTETVAPGEPMVEAAAESRIGAGHVSSAGVIAFTMPGDDHFEVVEMQPERGNVS